MVKYRVDITDEALADMESIYEYIAFKLLVTVTNVLYGASDIHKRLKK